MVDSEAGLPVLLLDLLDRRHRVAERDAGLQVEARWSPTGTWPWWLIAIGAAVMISVRPGAERHLLAAGGVHVDVA